MNSLFLITIFSTFFFRISSCNEKLNLTAKYFHHNTASLDQILHNGTSHLRSWRTTHLHHSHRHLKTVHGTLNIIGWGILLPIGIIVARHCKKWCKEWYSLHILSQLSGFLLGSLGWGIGLSIKNAAKEHSLSTHGILGTVIFAFATLQLSASICLRTEEEQKGCRKFWVIYHHVLGYALIIMIIANIFEGINYQKAGYRWTWFYGVVLGVLAFIALTLEIFKRKL